VRVAYLFFSSPSSLSLCLSVSLSAFSRRGL